MSHVYKIPPAQDHQKAGASFLKPELNRRILVVEDEPDIARAYTEILAGEQTNVTPIQRSSRSSRSESTAAITTSYAPATYEVTVAKNGEMAIAIVKQAIQQGKPFALGFFDVLLGDGMDGIELFKQVRAVDPQMYGVFVTAYNDRSVDSINEFLGAEAADHWDYLNKPFTEGEIQQKARQVVSMWNLRQEKLVQEQALAEANRRLMDSERKASVAAVARGVGHEFGNILVQIMGRAELSLKGSPAQMKSALETILVAAETASEILTRFKNLEKSPEQKVSKEWLFIHEPLDEALQLLQHQLEVNNVRICRIKQDKVRVYASHTSLVQVFVNLLINALHAMSASAGQIDLSIKKEASMVEVRLRDYGPGIPVDLLEKVMEPFFTTKGNLGTGLGLAISREIIEIEHQGHFMVTNHNVKGAEMIIQLPLVDEDGNLEGAQE